MLLRHIAALLGAAIIACRPSDAPPGGARADTGAGVRLDAPARRIVSLSPALTELLFAIGAGDRLVGRTRWGTEPPEAAYVPSVGDGLNPNVEAIVARRPDLVVLYASASNSPAVRQLRSLDITVVTVRLDRLSELARAARLLGRLVGDSARADSLAAGLEAELSRLAAPLMPMARVLIVAWHSPPIVIGAASFLSEIVELAGGRNVFADIDRPSFEVGLEEVVAREPDVVLVPDQSGTPALARRPEWQVVTAVREGRFVTLSGTEFSWPSFRAPRAIELLRAVLQRAVR